MPKDNDWGHTLPIGTIICDNDYPEDVGIIIERNFRGSYKVYAITGGSANSGKIDWYDRDYIENKCSVVIEPTIKTAKEEKEKEKKKAKEKKL